MSEHLTPTAVVERIIGRPEVIGIAIGADPKLSYSWRRSSKSRDAGDIPSARHMRRLLAYAAARGLPLTAEDLIFGTSEAELAARLMLSPIPGVPHAQDGKTAGGDASAAFSFRSRAGRPVTGAVMQAADPKAAGLGGPAADYSRTLGVSNG